VNYVVHGQDTVLLTVSVAVVVAIILLIVKDLDVVSVKQYYSSLEMMVLLKQTNLKNLRMQKNDVYVKRTDGTYINIRSQHTVNESVVQNWLDLKRASKL
jgi:hypothetical protein